MNPLGTLSNRIFFQNKQKQEQHGGPSRKQKEFAERQTKQII